jgi:hypothetical protein
MSEYDRHGRRRTDDDETPDVEAHRNRIRRGDDDPAPTELNQHFHRRTDDGEDDGPDVEAHVFNTR